MTYLPNDLAGFQLLDLKRLEAVFVDLDDTLVDYRNSCIAGLGQVSRIVPQLSGTDVNMLEAEFRELLRDNIPRILSGEISVDQERGMRISSLLRNHGSPYDSETLSKCDTAFNEGFWGSRKVMDGAGEFLEKCMETGLPVIIITNGNFHMQKRTLDMLGLEKYVQALLAPETPGELKPNGVLFEKAISLTKAARRKTVMIGDTWQHDIVGAINAGIRPVWINRHEFTGSRNPEVLEIRSLRELL